MRFGGHETFAVREDWLSKGLFLLKREPEAFDDPLVADQLGVGRNMGKSIRHWLQVTGLTEKAGNDRTPTMTSIARTLYRHDRYMLHSGTWWALHINLICQNREAVAWPWFFNRFGHDRFDRVQCVEQLQRYITIEGQRPPSPKTVARDISCLLASYSRSVPLENTDPEEGQDSPFRGLDLLTHYRDSDTYAINRRPKDVPPELLCYAFARGWAQDAPGGESLEISFNEALAHPGGPGRAFALTSEGLMELLGKAELELGDTEIRTRLMGAERVIQVKNYAPATWLKHYYKRVNGT